jgi:hypothetical protein
MKPGTLPGNIAPYLQRESSDKWKPEWIEFPGIQMVIVIPAICESENIRKLLLSLAHNDRSCLEKSLVLFVINNSVSSASEIKADNIQTIKLLRDLIYKNVNNRFADGIYSSGMKIGLIDASSTGNEFEDKKAGVGLARKTGMDASLRMFDYSINENKIIISLDADCTVEQNYLREISRCFSRFNFSAATIDFEHDLSEKGISKTGILSYEIFLRHYVSGLLFANSPFAFHTIGSIITCTPEAYIKAGGMNTKKAAEDFYFLQKLAKHYTINKINTTRVKPSGRESWRVPFGTGRSMTEYSSNKKAIEVYDPEVYIILKNWLELFYSDVSLNPDIITKESKKIHPELYNFLESRGFSSDWESILKNSKSARQLNQQRKNLFDGFETLKLLHHMRDTAFSMMEIKPGTEKLFKLLQLPFKFNLSNGGNNAESLFVNYLSELRSLENSLQEIKKE